MKKLINLITIFSILFLIGFISAFSGSGAGTSGDPYQITNCTQLQEMENDLSANYKVMNLIWCNQTSNLSNPDWNQSGVKGFRPVGNTSQFTGNLDGQNYEIWYLKSLINTFSQDVAIFSNLNGTVSNVKLMNPSFQGKKDIGIITANNYGNIDNIYIELDLISQLEPTGSNQILNLGGLVANNYGTISNSEVIKETTYGTTGYILAFGTFYSGTKNYAGGLVGTNIYGGIIYNSFSNVDLFIKSSRGGFSGGLVGLNKGLINKTYASGYVWNYDPTGALVTDYLVTGGLVGTNRGDYAHTQIGEIYNSYAIGNATSQVGSGTTSYLATGGLAGTNYGIIKDCYARGNSTTIGSADFDNANGGLVGENARNSPSGINRTYSTGYVSGGSSIGGLIGLNQEIIYNSSEIGRVNNSFWDINTSGRTTSARGTGKNTTLMKDIRTFISKLFSGSGLEEAWDFIGNDYNDTFNNDIWGINSSINNGYPYLIGLDNIGFSETPTSSIITIVLIEPTNNYYFNHTNNLFLKFIGNSTVGLSICELWGNFTGNWSKNYTWNSPVSESLTNTSLNLSNNFYKWNVWCNNSLNNNSFALNNYTFGVDTINPVINQNISIATSQNTVYFTTDISGAVYCYYTILDENDSVNGANENISFTCNQLSSATTSGYGNFTFVVDAYDYAWNYIQQNKSFTTTYIPQGGGGVPQQQLPTNPVISTGQPVLTSGNWTIETELGGNKYQFNMIQNSERTRDLLFENLGVIDRTITMDCVKVSGTDDLCQGIQFVQDEFKLPVQKSIKTSNGFTLTIPENYEKGTYIVNLVGVDESNNIGVITLEVKITSRASITGAITKLFTSTDYGVPYVLFFLVIVFIFGVASNYIIFKPNRLPSALALLVGLFFGIVFLLLPI